MDYRRRELLKVAAYAAGAGIGLKGLHETGSEVYDLLNGECDKMTDSITLGPGDAAVYRHDDQTYYLEHKDTNFGVEARFGPLSSEKESITVSPYEARDAEAAVLTEKDRLIPFYVHVNLGDIITGGDVVEPRGFLGLALEDIQATFDEPVCVIERGEASELGN